MIDINTALGSTINSLSSSMAINDGLVSLMGAFNSLVFYSVKLFGVDVPVVILFLILATLYFTIYFKFINIRAFRHALRLVRGDYSDPNAKGSINHFQALCTALSGTIGVGNIGAVAFAIVVGGPGACFWLIVAGLFGMTTKLVECTLGVKYRKEYPDGTTAGGPMYYLNQGLADLGFPKIGKGMSYVYAFGMTIGCLGSGNMFQSNQAYEQLRNVTGGDSSFFAEQAGLFGLILAIIVGLVIIGGIKSIAKVTSRLVPLMAGLYLTGAFVVLSLNFEYIPMAIMTIVREAFSPEGISGGMIGVIFLSFKRAVFSNEAGLGSAAIAHSAVKTDNPITEGIVSLLEPFLDTVVVCTITALVIVTTMVAIPDFQEQVTEGSNLVVGIKLTSAAFGQQISFFPYLLAFIAFMFAVSTIITWSYYGLKSWTYLVGEGKKRALFYNFIYCSFIILGTLLDLPTVLDFSDALIYFLCVPNLIGLFILAPVVKKELNEYMLKLKNKEIVPNNEK